MAHEYDLAAMAKFLTDLDRQLEQITDKCSQCKQAATGIMGTYEGKAADAFLDAHLSWQTTMAQHLESLRSLRARVQVAHDNYAEAERLNGEMLTF